MIQNVEVYGKYIGPVGELIAIPRSSPDVVPIDVGTTENTLISAIGLTAELRYGFDRADSYSMSAGADPCSLVCTERVLWFDDEYRDYAKLIFRPEPVEPNDEDEDLYDDEEDQTWPALGSV